MRRLARWFIDFLTRGVERDPANTRLWGKPRHGGDGPT
jgi:hypothetical protein